MGAALAAVEPLIDELFHPHEIEVRLAAVGVAVDPSTLRPEFDAVLTQVRRAATLPAAVAGPVPVAPGSSLAHGSSLAPGSDRADCGDPAAPIDRAPTAGFSPPVGGHGPGQVGVPPAGPGFTPAASASAPAGPGLTPAASASAPAGPGFTPAEAGEDPPADGPPRDARPEQAGFGRDGVHGAELTELLGELQGLARELPGGVW
jgi:hypothetical protein